MPETGTQVRESGDDVVIGEKYEITNVELITTDVSAYKGFRVSLLTKKAQEGTVMLWQRQVTSKKSKLGTFIDLLGSNTDDWLHKWIQFVDWRIGNRKLELVKK
jgi:hypothetical protein